jgi:hypothetical protein
MSFVSLSPKTGIVKRFLREKGGYNAEMGIQGNHHSLGA